MIRSKGNNEMKLERTKNATRNMLFGFILKAYQIVIPFVMRTAMIYLLGAQYLGLNSLFISVLQVLNLAELGIGSAMVYSMYKPIVEDDKAKICALMNLYRKYYHIIGVVIFLLGMVLLPFIPRLIKGDVPADINVYILYLMNLIATVLSYWLFAYKNSILTAHQRNDITSKVMLLTETCKYALQLIVLVFARNYYLYVLVILMTQVVTNILTAIIADKMYPEYQAKGKLLPEEVNEINVRIRDLFTSKLGYVIVNSADTIVISAFLGLTVLAIYQNYYYLITAVTGFIAIIFTSLTAGVGNSLISETREKNFSDFKKITFLITWIVGLGSICFLSLFQPFMELWVGKELLLDFPTVICLCVYFYISEINALLNLYKDAAGMWHEDRFRPLVTALANLFMNLIMVQFIGIYGIILSTVLSIMLVGMPWLLHNLFSVIFDKTNIKKYIFQLLKYACITIITGAITYRICLFVNVALFPTLIIRLCICLVVPNIIFFFTYHKQPEYKECIILINKMTKGKISFLNKTCEINA